MIWQKKIPSFMCVYCGCLHPDSFNTDEHINPKSLKNNSHVLHNACKMVNNYIADSFEKLVLQLDTIKDILLLTEPPKVPVYRSKTTVEGIEVSRWVLPNGAMELVELPKYTEKRERIPLKSAKQISEYLELLLKDPGIDPEFEKFFHQIGGITSFNKQEIQETALENEGQKGSMVEFRETTLVYTEYLFKLF